MTISKLMLAAAAILPLAACATPPHAGPVEVTRFLAPASTAELGKGTIFVESAPGSDDPLALAPYKAAVARELVRLGYRETDRAEASQVAQVRIEKGVTSPLARRGGPVSVGVGGSTGSYGSGVGVGLGIDLSPKPRDTLDTQVHVMIRDKASGTTYWEGRAQFSVSDNSRFAASEANAAAMADALFRDFPGNNGETIDVRVNE